MTTMSPKATKRKKQKNPNQFPTGDAQLAQEALAMPPPLALADEANQAKTKALPKSLTLTAAK